MDANSVKSFFRFGYFMIAAILVFWLHVGLLVYAVTNHFMLLKVGVVVSGVVMAIIALCYLIQKLLDSAR